MKGKIAAVIIFLLFIFFFTSGLFEGIVNFLTWLVTLNMTQSTISMAGEIFVKIAAWIISYTAVGILFNAVGWFNSDAMKFVYFIISTLVSFALCYVVMLFETYLLYIVIALGVLLAGTITFVIVLYIKRKKVKNNNRG
jgi:integral membrane protein